MMYQIPSKVLKEERNVEYRLYDVDRPGIVEKIAPYIFAAVLFAFYVMMLSTQISASSGIGGSGGLANFGKSRAEKNANISIRFSDVAGLDEEKEELEK